MSTSWHLNSLYDTLTHLEECTRQKTTSHKKMLWCNFSFCLTRSDVSMMSLDEWEKKQFRVLKATSQQLLMANQHINVALWNFPRHSNITSFSLRSRWCQERKKTTKRNFFCSVNFTSFLVSLLWVCFFSSLMLWVTVHVSISTAFLRRECEGEIEMVYRLFFRFRLFVFTRCFFGWNLNFFSNVDRKGDL